MRNFFYGIISFRLVFILGVFMLSLLSCDVDKSGQSGRKGAGFVEINTSGIDFSNKITHDVSTKENLLDFDYFYNGSGVGIGDLNNDGLLDIVFTGNQVENRIYENRGGLKFNDVTDGSGINDGKYWSNGICLADVNQDGWLDIYISQGGPYERAKRKNTLLINQRDLTFKEMALEYGLDDQGISTQAAFFDCDNDGDLDCFVLNESELYGHDPIAFHRILFENPGKFDVSFSQLYENRGGKFFSISKDAGINAPTFGLGLAVSDINQDGWLDIYVANDYYLPDNLYINRKNGKFVDQAKNRLHQMSFYGMGVDIADLDNDAHQDILVLDMASKDHYRSKTLMASMDVKNFSLLVDQLDFPHQYMFNTVQINNGKGAFFNVAHMSGLAKTDWSWAPLAEDFDLDGDKDCFVTNGYRRYALDNDFKLRVADVRRKYGNAVPVSVKKELYNSMPSEALSNLMYRNDGDLHFEEIGKEWGLSQETFSNGAAAGDLDNDGDLDLVINNIDQPALLYKNLTRENTGNNYLKLIFDNKAENQFAKVTAWTEKGQLHTEVRTVRGYRSSLPNEIILGFGNNDKIDAFTIDFLDGRKLVADDLKINHTYLLSDLNAIDPNYDKNIRPESRIKTLNSAAMGLDFRHMENDYNDFEKEILLPQKQSTIGPALSVGDVNGDGLEDLFVSGASGQESAIYFQSEGGQFSRSSQPAFIKDKICEDVGAVFFDLEGDEDLDLIVVAGGNAQEEGHMIYANRLYVNNGSGIYSRKSVPDLGKSKVSSKCVEVIDYDGDGDHDILIGNRIVPQSYPISAPSYLLENRNGSLVDVTQKAAPELSDLGIINDLEVTDINGDGRMDFVAVGEWTGIHFFINNGGSFSTPENHKKFINETGWWFSVHKCDINSDGKIDFLVGNIGENIKHKASKEKPFKVYASDFDQSGSLDIVLSSEYKGNYVPVRGRECSSQQMPMIAQKFETYASFASSTLEEVYGEENLRDAYTRSAVEFSSVVLVNRDTGFDMIKLPQRAQSFPLLDAVFSDVDEDGTDDVIIAGCIYETEVETPRLDAGHGLVLLSGETKLEVGSCPEYCLNVPGNVKSLTLIEIAGIPHLLAGKNNDDLSIFRLPVATPF